LEKSGIENLIRAKTRMPPRNFFRNGEFLVYRLAGGFQRRGRLGAT
jgi:hypothetical protein